MSVEVYLYKLGVKIKSTLYQIVDDTNYLSFTILSNTLSGRIMMSINVPKQQQQQKNQAPLNTCTNLGG